VRTISDKDLKAPFVKTRSEESVPRPAGDETLEPESKKYLGSVPLFYEENHKDYNQFASLVTEQLRPTNILEEIWVKDYTYWYLEAQRLSRFKQNDRKDRAASHPERRADIRGSTPARDGE
jgi:hypothetical protein